MHPPRHNSRDRKAPTALRAVLVPALVTLMLPAAARAQPDWRAVAVPYYDPRSFVQGQVDHWQAPRAREFDQAAATMADRVRAYCAATGAASRPAATPQATAQTRQPLNAARQAWHQALLAWSRLSAVPTGPLVQRRSAQQVDYAPVRPEQIRRAIERHPAGAADMARQPSAAKGFGALEHLLWPPARGPLPPCPYAAEVAADIAREAGALALALQHTAADAPDEAATVAAMGEVVNQWIGAVEKLRLQGLERPLREAQARGHGRPVFARTASGASRTERMARWHGLQALAVLPAGPAPAPGAGLVPLETYLRGKGLNPLADRLVQQVRAADAALRAAAAAAPARLQAAARSLAALGALVEAEVAPALDIRVGFSDADGD